ncbi:MAG: DinB family protein [Candidatus Thorarchaeota archaeon]
MDGEEKEIVSLQKSENLEPRITQMYGMLEKVRERLLKRIEGLTQKELDFTPNEENIESIGTLLLHIAGVEWSWIFEDMDHQEMDYEKWKHAFAVREGIPQLKGKKLKFYTDRLSEVREEVLERISELSDSELDHLIELDQAAVSIEWILFHIIEHEAMHIGQISMLTRLYKMSS